jgi:hypothetical protein
MLVVAANYSYLMRLRHGCDVYAYTKEVFGDDHAFLCAWFLYISHISIVFLNTTALFVVARLLMGNAQLSTPSYVLAGRDGMPRKRRQRQSCAVFGHAEHPPHAGRRHSAFGNMFTKKHMHPRINRAFWVPPGGGLALARIPTPSQGTPIKPLPRHLLTEPTGPALQLNRDPELPSGHGFFKAMDWGILVLS